MNRINTSAITALSQLPWKAPSLDFLQDGVAQNLNDTLNIDVSNPTSVGDLNTPFNVQSVNTPYILWGASASIKVPAGAFRYNIGLINPILLSNTGSFTGSFAITNGSVYQNGQIYSVATQSFNFLVATWSVTGTASGLQDVGGFIYSAFTTSFDTLADPTTFSDLTLRNVHTKNIAAPFTYSKTYPNLSPLGGIVYNIQATYSQGLSSSYYGYPYSLTFSNTRTVQPYYKTIVDWLEPNVSGANGWRIWDGIGTSNLVRLYKPVNSSGLQYDSMIQGAYVDNYSVTVPSFSFLTSFVAGVTVSTNLMGTIFKNDLGIIGDYNALLPANLVFTTPIFVCVSGVSNSTPSSMYMYIDQNGNCTWVQTGAVNNYTAIGPSASTPTQWLVQIPSFTYQRQYPGWQPNGTFSSAGVNWSGTYDTYKQP